MRHDVQLPRYHDEPMWWNWLCEGFTLLGYGDRAKYTKKELSSDRIGFVYPMVFEIDGKRYLWDFMDYTTLTRPDEPCHKRFKIQLLEEHIRNGVVPIPQICGKLEIETIRRFIFKKHPKREYVYDVLGMFRTTDFHTRYKWIEIVRSMNLNSKLSLLQSPDRPIVPEHISQERLKYEDHLELQYLSKINLAVPGIGIDGGSAWSFRTSELMALGCFFIMPRHKCFYPYFEKKICVECTEEELPDTINYYLTHDEEREEIGRNAKEYFEKYIRPDSYAKYILANL